MPSALFPDSEATYSTAENKFINVNGVQFAYRWFGSSVNTNVPLVPLIHFRGTMDHWDPNLIDPIAAVRPVILIDNSGVGRSEGTIPPTYASWADNIINVLKALELHQIDLLGFSMGGFVAQMVALNEPGLVRRLILAGTGPSAGEGVEAGDPQPTMRLATAATEKEHHDGFLETFYSLTEKKQTLGDTWWKRMTTSRSDRSPYVDAEGTQLQVGAAMRWGDPEYRAEGSFDRLHEIKIPVLIANGAKDILIPTVNSWVLFRRLTHADAHLHLFPDVGHGFLNEYADQFSKLINMFLDA
jgi:pimeloyl-ACP methyl ester carboxylesterase